MRWNFCRMCLLVLGAAAFAQQSRRDREDLSWAVLNRMPKEEVQQIRRAIGIADDAEGVLISHFDSQSLRRRNQILVVERRADRCLRVHVMERRGAKYQEVWKLDGVPKYSWSSDMLPICPQAPRNPTVQANAQGQIVVEMPVLSDPGQRSPSTETYTFVWDGRKYVPSGDHP